MNKKASISLLTAIIAIIIVGSGIGVGVAYNEGYVPINPLLPVVAPDGAEAVTNETNSEIICCKLWLGELLENYKITEFKYKLYTIESMAQTASGIISNYSLEMLKDRFDDAKPYSSQSEYNSISRQVWEVEWHGYKILCGLWIKGLTFRALFITSCPPTSVWDSASHDKSYCILFMTGSKDSYYKVFRDSVFIPVIPQLA